ncbi:MAG: hypothetical protein K8U57_03460 [Planctomycetes bacterium]|nr:hypothetical protein [Planctomycetota bacterium]
MTRRWVITMCGVLTAMIALTACGCGSSSVTPANVNEVEKKKADDDMEKTKKHTK